VKNFKVSCVQIASGPNIEANLLETSKYIEKAKDAGAKLVVLPENFAIMAANDQMYLEFKEEFGNGKIQDFISSEALKNDLWIIAGTIPISSNKKNKVYSKSIIFNNKGEIVSSYNKIHLFDVNILETNEKYNESDVFISGNSIEIVETPFCKIGIAICYDLRFPELFRLLAEKGANLICVPAAFTSFTGKAHWEYLVRSRAIENLLYIAASAQGGYHVNGRETHGNSLIVNPWGEILSIKKNGAGIVTSEIDLNYQSNLRKNFPCLDHRKKIK